MSRKFSLSGNLLLAYIVAITNLRLVKEQSKNGRSKAHSASFPKTASPAHNNFGEH